MYGPFDLNGPQFIQLYLLLGAAAIAIGFIIPGIMRPTGRAQSVADVDELAWLNGGWLRLAESAVTRLMTARIIEHLPPDNFRRDGAGTAKTPVEAAILKLPMPTSWRKIGPAVKAGGDAINDRLIRQGLIMTADQVFRLRYWQTMPYVLLIGFGAIKLMVGEARHKPVGILTMMLLFTVVFGVFRWLIVDRRTEAGIRAVKDAKASSTRLRTAPTASEMGMGVALFGTTVLAGSWFETFHKMRTAGSGDGSSSSTSGGGSSDGGGGGCGGGGCGGCSS